MEMSGERRLQASRETVWAALNDADVLRQCVPGCQELEQVSETEFSARVISKIGPIKATFKGRVTLSDLDPPNSYTISGEGQGGMAGFAKGSAVVSLDEVEPGVTLLCYDVQASVGGKIAQLGARLIDSTSKRMADEFFTTFAEIVSGGSAEHDSDAPTAA
jgi:hypothetical protein